jgi:hypothetical protein
LVWVFRPAIEFGVWGWVLLTPLTAFIYAAGFLSSIVGDIRDALSSIYKYNTFHRK